MAGPGDLPGYPQLTGQAERKIFGGNLLRLHGMDAQVMRANLAGGASLSLATSPGTLPIHPFWLLRTFLLATLSSETSTKCHNGTLA